MNDKDKHGVLPQKKLVRCIDHTVDYYVHSDGWASYIDITEESKLLEDMKLGNEIRSHKIRLDSVEATITEEDDAKYLTLRMKITS